MDVFLIRHGQTAGNQEGRYIGRSDEGLSPQGIRQLRYFPGISSPALVYVSALKRTGESAKILFPQALQAPCPDLGEMDFGLFEGRNASEMEKDPLYRAWVAGGCLSACPGGEGRAAFQDRVCRRFLALVKAAENLGKQQAVFVIHGGSIMAILERFSQTKRDFYDWHRANGQGWRAVWDGAQLLNPETI